jgi:hypothetical protein
VGELEFQELREERRLRREREAAQRAEALTAIRGRQAVIDRQVGRAWELEAAGVIAPPIEHEILARAGVTEHELQAAEREIEMARALAAAEHREYVAARRAEDEAILAKVDAVLAQAQAVRADAEAARADAVERRMACVLPELNKLRSGEERRTRNLLIQSKRQQDARARKKEPAIQRLLERARAGEKLEALAAEAKAAGICSRTTLYDRAHRASITRKQT